MRCSKYIISAILHFVIYWLHLLTFQNVHIEKAFCGQSWKSCFVLLTFDTTFTRGKWNLLFAYLAYSVMLWKPVKVENGEHQGLVKSVRVWKVFKLESFVKKRIQCFSVDFCFKLFLTLYLWYQTNLQHVENWDGGLWIRWIDPSRRDVINKVWEKSQSPGEVTSVWK